MTVDEPRAESYVERGALAFCGQYLRQKRAHKKSRHGCFTCKRRRVKCDESSPRCKACSMRGIECVYPVSGINSPDLSSSLSVDGRWSRSWPAADDSSNSTPKLMAFQVTDAMLWQYYLSHAGGTLAAAGSDPAHAELWRVNVPAVAFGNPGVSHALMAISALCMASSGDVTASSNLDYAATANLHYCHSLEFLQAAIFDLEQANADAVLACSMVLIPCGIALARQRRSYGDACQWLHHLRGFRLLGSTISALGSRASSQPELVPYPQYGIPAPEEYVVALSSKSCGKHSQWLETIRLTMREPISKLRIAVVTTAPDLTLADAEAYRTAIDQIEYVLNYICDCEVSNYFRAVFTWPILISSRFSALMVGLDQLALAIMQHWLVTTLMLDDCWWVKGFGAFRIPLVERAFGNDRSPYLDLLEWPREMLYRWESLSPGGPCEALEAVEWT